MADRTSVCYLVKSNYYERLPKHTHHSNQLSVDDSRGRIWTHHSGPDCPWPARQTASSDIRGEPSCMGRSARSRPVEAIEVIPATGGSTLPLVKRELADYPVKEPRARHSSKSFGYSCPRRRLCRLGKLVGLHDRQPDKRRRASTIKTISARTFAPHAKRPPKGYQAQLPIGKNTLTTI